jgi:guanylate kinase
MLNKGLVLVISGPSGSGKSTLCDRLLGAVSGNYGLVVSHTSRPIRGTEVDGEDYVFVSKEQFKENLSNDMYLEWAEVHGNYYGTPISHVQQFQNEGKDVVLEIDVQGGLQVKEKLPDTVLIFVAPPAFSQIEKRLTGRGTDSKEVIEHRLKNAIWELDQIPHYDYLLLNDELEKAVKELHEIIAVEKKRVQRLNLGAVFAKLRPH